MPSKSLSKELRSIVPRPDEESKTTSVKPEGLALSPRSPMMSSSSSSSICGTEAKEEFYRKGLLGSMNGEESKNTSHVEMVADGGDPPLGDRRAIEELIKETQDTFKRFEELK